jgi:hypothetical protein
MSKDEALDLALEALEGADEIDCDMRDAITAIKQARALDKMAENARELGLDYEPADGTQVSKVWWDGEKLMAKPIPLEDIYQPVQATMKLESSGPGHGPAPNQKLSVRHVSLIDAGKTPPVQPAPVQEAVSGYIKKIEDLIQERNDARSSRDFYKRRADALQQWQSKMRDPERTIVCDILANGCTLEPAGDRYTTPPAAQRQWVGLTDEEVYPLANEHLHHQIESYEVSGIYNLAQAIEAKLKEKNAATQPSVPDAMTSADIQESIEYVAGWNECRQAMLEMMK